MHRRIAEAARRAGRDEASVCLVAVTKGRGTNLIRLAYEAGLRVFGENRVEEALPKLGDLADLVDIEWHMVGHVQSRKAKLVAPRFSMVHSVDRLKIARRLDLFAGECNRILPVLLECNVSGEMSKEGWKLAERGAWEREITEIEEVVRLPNLEVRGLMTMAPWTEDMEVVKRVFRTLRQLQSFLEARLPGHWRELSMGMTDDFEVAVEEGATIVRIGRAIFGERDN